jgi:DNA helicase II / ATP-dependent DNA helicase PcrA
MNLEGLNAEQKEAVQSVMGRVLVLAGAGTGKTRVLTMRMCYLINQLEVPPKHILGLTFTNKAATEMLHRMAALVSPNVAKQVTLCTFHSFCIQILRAEIERLGYTSEFTIYREGDVQRLVSHIARDMLEREKELPSLGATMAVISNAKNKGLLADQIQKNGNTWHDQFSATVYRRLQDSMRAYNAVDFDDLLVLTVRLFENHPDILARYQEQYRYIMIDEYQDTNPIQYRLAALLSAKYNNLCVVGDDDQSIYGWRGAEVRNILEFDQAKIIKLEQNYRSTNTILKAANAVISKNQSRYPKVLWSTKGEGEQIEIFHAPKDSDEAEAVVYRLVKMKEAKGLRWKDFAILYRSNALARAFEAALMKYTWSDHGQWTRGIPYHIFGGVEFYERREVKDLCAYLRIIVNPKDQEALLRIINQPRRGIGEGSLDALTGYNRKQGLPLWDVLKMACSGQIKDEEIRSSLPAKALKGLETFVSTVDDAKKKFENGSLSAALQELIETIHYRKAIEEEVKSTQMREFKWENCQEFVKGLADYERKVQEELHKKPTLRDFLTTFSLENDWEHAARQKKAQEDRVSLMTFHSAKGLEFPVCFLVGIEDRIIPHEKSVKETGIEEERRLMYVAMTRAMENLVISLVCKRSKMGQETVCKPSPFILDIQKELVRVTQWDA